MYRGETTIGMSKNNKTYKAVFFDWDNTIGDFSHAAEKALRELYQEYQLYRFFPSFNDYYTIYEEHNLYLWDMYGIGKMSKEQLQFERFAYPLQQTSETTLSEQEINDLATKIGDKFCQLTTDYFSLMPYAAEVIPRLAEHYPLTLISNGFIEVQYQKINNSGLRPFFQHIVLSEEVGIQKPQSQIFRIALEQNGINADEAVMVGDSYFNDIAGAKAVGIDQIWIKDTATPQLPDQSATWIVPNLLQAASLLVDNN